MQPPAWLEDGAAKHLFGTDQLGRDLYVRLLTGLRVSLAIGLITATSSALIGVSLGLLAGYFRGATEGIIMRLADIQLAFPLLVLAIAILALVGGSLVPLVLVLSLFGWAIYARVVRASVLVQGQMDYVDAARTAGFSHARIIFRHIAPNVVAPYLIMLTAFVAQAILAEASLSFLGLGVTEPTPSWGLMLSGAAADFYQQAPWMIVFPGVAISLAVFAFNLFGDSLRDWLDPKIKV